MVVREPPELSEEVRPVVLTAAYQRQQLRSSVAHVYGHIPAILRDPPHGDGRSMSVGAAPEVDDERRRYDELKQGAAEELEELAEGRKDQVTGLVDGQIDRVEQAPGLGSEEAGETIQG
jgi:hypothetical protein